MVLDPLSAFSVACNVLQVIEVGAKLLSNAAEYHKAVTGSLPEHEELRKILDNLQGLSKVMQSTVTEHKQAPPLSPAETRLVQANAECLRLSNEFTGLLSRLTAKDPHGKVESLRVSFRALRYKEKVEAMEKAISQARDNLNLAFLIYMNTKQATLANQQAILRSNSDAEENILSAVRVSSVLIKDDIQDLAERLQHTTLDTGQQIMSEFQKSHQSLLEQISSQLKSSSAPDTDATDAEEKQQDAKAQQRILLSLQFPQIQERRNLIREAHEDTFQWILSPQPEKDQWVLGSDRHPTQRWDDFTKWLSSPRANKNIYWIRGKPGSGKSTLMRYLDDNLDIPRHTHPWAAGRLVIRAHCFFWSPGNALQKSLVGLLRTLLLQLFEQTPSLISQVVPPRKWLAAKMTSTHAAVDWSEAELVRALRDSVLRLRSFANALFLADGLDEFEGSDEQRDELVELFTELAQMDNIKICLSSRPWNVFEDGFGNCPKLRLEDLTLNDINKYVATRLQSNLRFQRLFLNNPFGADNLIWAITKKAEGVFLWARLVVRELLNGLRDGDRIPTLWKKFNAIPSDLNEHFKFMMESIQPEHRYEASVMLQIALHEEHDFVSLHPLRLLDLSFIDEGRPDFALTERYNFRDFDILDSESIQSRCDSTARMLKSRCMGLLECSFQPGDDYYGMYELDLPDTDWEISTRSMGVSFEPSVYSEIFKGHSPLRPFMVTVDFLHRSCRDFLRTPEIQSILYQHTGGPYDARTFILSSRLAQIVALCNAKAGQNLSVGLSSYAISLLSLKSWKDSTQSIVAATVMRSSVEALFRDESADKTEVWYIDSSRVTWHEERSSFLTLAIDFDLLGYIKRELTPSHVLNKPGRPILDYVLRPRFAQWSGDERIATRSPNLQLVRLVLSYGANPNEAYQDSSVWGHFLSFVADSFRILEDRDSLRIVEEDQLENLYEGLSLLIEAGASAYLPASWVSAENWHYQSSLSYNSWSINTLKSSFHKRWPQSFANYKVKVDIVSGDPWIAVTDLLEDLRPQLGVGVDRLKALLEKRTQ